VFSACVGVATFLASCGEVDPSPAYCRQFVGERPVECENVCVPGGETEGCDDVEASED
jgi:hypothetical protein